MCVGNTIKKLPTLLKTKQNKLKKSGKMDNRKRPTLRFYMYVCKSNSNSNNNNNNKNN